MLPKLAAVISATPMADSGFKELLVTLAELKKSLEEILARSKVGGYDEEGEHSKADWLLLEYIGDEEVSRVFSSIPRWYG